MPYLKTKDQCFVITDDFCPDSQACDSEIMLKAFITARYFYERFSKEITCIEVYKCPDSNVYIKGDSKVLIYLITGACVMFKIQGNNNLSMYISDTPGRYMTPVRHALKEPGVTTEWGVDSTVMVPSLSKMFVAASKMLRDKYKSIVARVEAETVDGKAIQLQESLARIALEQKQEEMVEAGFIEMKEELASCIDVYTFPIDRDPSISYYKNSVPKRSTNIPTGFLNIEITASIKNDECDKSLTLYKYDLHSNDIDSLLNLIWDVRGAL